MSVYTVRTVENGWRVTKFDQDLNVESSYELGMHNHGSKVYCNCPQSARGHCRHIDILGTFQAFDRVNTGWFLNFDSGEWSPPLETGETPPPRSPDGSRKHPPLTSPSGFVFGNVERIRRI